MQTYEDALLCPVEFGTQEYSVTFPAELLDAPCRFADAHLNALLRRWRDQCTAAIAQPIARAVAMRVMAVILQDPLGFREISEELVAASLRIERRSLQRRLAAERTSFRSIVDAMRAQHAVTTLLRGTSSLVELTAEVGFDQQSSLCRAFQRWTGYSPLELRRRLADVFCDLRPVEA